MMSSKRASKLVDAAFEGGFSSKQGAKLQEVLASSGDAAQRYRRLQLAERVAAHGPEAALETPSEFEIDRIARNLGLLAPEPRPSRWRAWISPWVLTGGLVLSSAVVLFTLSVPPPEIQARGGHDALSFSTYAITTQGAISVVSPGASLTPQDRLKVRLSWQGEVLPLSGVWVGVVDQSGRVRVTSLAAPDTQVATVPGLVDLGWVAPGDVRVYVVGSSTSLAESALVSALSPRPDAATIKESLGAVAVDLVDVRVEGSAGP